MADDREPYGQTFHEQGRLTVNAERKKPFAVGPWEDRTSEQQEIDMRGASAVAARAVHDAGFDQAHLAAEVIRLRVRLDHAVQNERDAIARAILDRADRATPGVERDALLTAAAIAKGTEP